MEMSFYEEARYSNGYTVVTDYTLSVPDELSRDETVEYIIRGRDGWVIAPLEWNLDAPYLLIDPDNQESRVGLVEMESAVAGAYVVCPHVGLN